MNVMNKKIFLTALACLVFGATFAQTSTVEEKIEYNADKYRVETNRFWHNWFFGIGGGAQILFSDHDQHADFLDRWAPALDVTVGKWLTPEFGLRLMYSGLQAKGATQNGIYSTGEAVPGKGGHGYWLTEQKFNMGNIHADVLFNVSNLICGYNPNRFWNVIPHAGLGWAMIYDSPGINEVTANVGIMNTFRLNDAFELNLDVKGLLVDDRFDADEGGHPREGMLAATIGITYKFEKRGWDRGKTVYRTDYGDLEGMRQKLNDLTAENERLNKLLAEAGQKTVVKKVASANLVTFKIGKSKLSNEARANLSLLAEAIKAGDADVVYTITGYADAGTGSKAGNEKLSQDRAQAVYDCLINEFGVNASQLKIDYKGGVDNMYYDDPRLSRAVITRGE